MRIKIAKWGNSAAIRLPKAILELMQVGEGSELELVMEGDRLVITRANPARFATLDALVTKMAMAGPELEPDSLDWGPDPAGERIEDEYSRGEFVSNPTADRRYAARGR
jgi:antitoxin MazE